MAASLSTTNLGALLGPTPTFEAKILERTLDLIRAGRPDDAEALLTRRALYERDSALLLVMLGALRAERGAYSAAADAFDEALERYVRGGGHARFEAELRLMRARALLAAGREGDAQVDLLLAAVGPDVQSARGAQALLTGIAELHR